LNEAARAADHLTALGSQVGKPTTGSDSHEEMGRGGGKVPETRVERGAVVSFGILPRGTNGTLRGLQEHLALQT
jgi:hypothetical protein